MLYLYMGTPGSGKSLYASGQILEALWYKKLVIANFPLSFKHLKGKLNQWLYGSGTICEVRNSELHPNFLIGASQYWFKGERPKESRILLVIDECSLIFNPRDWNRKDRTSWLEWLPQHRKYGYDIIMICQSDVQLDKQIRPLLEYRMQFKLVNSVVPGLLPIKIFSYTLSYYNTKNKAGRIRLGGFFYHEKWAKCYDTMRLFDDGNGGDGVRDASNAPKD